MLRDVKDIPLRVDQRWISPAGIPVIVSGTWSNLGDHRPVSAEISSDHDSWKGKYNVSVTPDGTLLDPMGWIFRFDPALERGSIGVGQEFYSEKDGRIGRCSAAPYLGSGYFTIEEQIGGLNQFAQHTLHVGSNLCWWRIPQVIVRPGQVWKNARFDAAIVESISRCDPPRKHHWKLVHYEATLRTLTTGNKTVMNLDEHKKCVFPDVWTRVRNLEGGEGVTVRPVSFPDAIPATVMALYMKEYPVEVPNLSDLKPLVTLANVVHDALEETGASLAEHDETDAAIRSRRAANHKMIDAYLKHATPSWVLDGRGRRQGPVWDRFCQYIANALEWHTELITVEELVLAMEELRTYHEAYG